MENYYQILGVPTTATQEEIKRSYRHLLLQTHPDKALSNGDAETVNNRTVTSLQEAYQVLSNEDSKALYDQDLSHALKKIGISDEGLDEYDLDEFEYRDEQGGRFVRSCPRCTVASGFTISEVDLMQNETNSEGEGEIIVQCAHCSLWLKVVYFDQGEDD